MTINAEILRGPFDPGGQPDTRSGQPMELGFFAWNIKGGMTASKAVLSNPARYQNFWEWPRASRLVRLAEEVGFDYQVPFAQWVGHGGPTEYNESSLDFLSTAAALAPMTSRIALFSTAHVTYRFHPMHFAKFGATIDYISGGRWGLNIVTGHIPREMALFGYKEPIPHDQGYAMADEFTTLLKYLWTSDVPVNFEGEYYQCYGGQISPKPVRKPRPILMNAGNSPVGLDFACRQADWAFITAPNLEGYKTKIATVREKARLYGREVRVATMVWVVMADTDEAAQAKLRWIEDEVDREATIDFVETLAGTSVRRDFNLDSSESDLWGGVGKEMFLRIALGITAWQIVGSYRTAAETIRELYDMGIESLLMCFFDPLGGLHQMEDHVLPILQDMGLRKPV